VVSHISRKTSEIWGTQCTLAGTECKFTVLTHALIGMNPFSAGLKSSSPLLKQGAPTNNSGWMISAAYFSVAGAFATLAVWAELEASVCN
jgi:hypothetical protein